MSGRVLRLASEREPTGRDREDPGRRSENGDTPWSEAEAPEFASWIEAPHPSTARWREPEAPEPSLCRLLTERDLEVLRLLAAGESTAEIARELAYSESMIKHVIHGVVNRIGARNRAHAVALAIRGGAI